LESKQKRPEFLSVFDEKRLSLARSTAAVISFIPSMENSFSFHCHSNISPVSGGAGNPIRRYIVLPNKPALTH
jgi:hypothetical protein